jgi:hypothetical protein
VNFCPCPALQKALCALPPKADVSGLKGARSLRTIAAKAPNEKADQKDYETYAGDGDNRLSVMGQTSGVPEK